MARKESAAHPSLRSLPARHDMMHEEPVREGLMGVYARAMWGIGCIAEGCGRRWIFWKERTIDWCSVSACSSIEHARAAWLRALAASDLGPEFRSSAPEGDPERGARQPLPFSAAGCLLSVGSLTMTISPSHGQDNRPTGIACCSMLLQCCT